MKEKDLDKNLETIIIDGLIKEAEQENADFAAAIRNMSDEEFEDMVREPAFADYDYGVRHDMAINLTGSAEYDSETMYAEIPSVRKAYRPIEDRIEADGPTQSSKKSRVKIFRPWITAAVSAAAVLLLILIPSFNAINAKLCDSALYMSEAYITPAKGGFDISSATTEQIKEELPNLEQQYHSTIEKDGKLIYYRDGFQDAGWTLAVAYLKLHKKSDAIKVLKTLESQTQGTPFGNHCKELLKQLD
ncbi:MAG: hypothetical protein NC453_21650 [Muribaculum sp.]|nr:hypothetical protein [Muribaculum sp.]